MVSIKQLRFGSLLSATELVRSVPVTSWGYWEKLQNACESVLVNNNAGKGQQKDHTYAIYAPTARLFFSFNIPHSAFDLHLAFGGL